MQRVSALVNSAKSEWLDGQMQKALPPDMYALAQNAKGRDRFKLARFLAANQVCLEEHPDRCVMFSHGKAVSEFSIKFNEGKMVTVVKDLTRE